MVEVERNNEYASRGVSNTALGFGLAGTALGLLNGGLNGLWANPLNANCAGTCNENMPVNRYELQLRQRTRRSLCVMPIPMATRRCWKCTSTLTDN